MKRYLITGGAGFIGTAIAKKLLEQKQFVRILDNEFRGSKKNFSPNSNNLEFIKADIRDYKNVLKACSKIDAIIHLAFINGTRYFYEKPDLVLSVGVKGIINVLDGASENGISELFLASSSEVYQTPPVIPTPEDVPYFIPSPFNPRYSYAGGKIISELLSLYIGRNIFKKVVIFRPHNVYGPNMGKEHVIPELIVKIKKLLKKNGPTISLPVKGNGSETRAFIYIDDFIEGLTILLQKGRTQEIYNIGTTEESSIKYIVHLLEKIVGKEIKIVPSQRPKGSVKRRCPDIQKIKKLGFSQEVTLKEGLLKTFSWYNTNHKL